MGSYRFALTPRWMAFHALVWLLLIPAFIGLGYWQRTLWQHRADTQGLVYAKLDAKPAAIASADPLGHLVRQDQQWQAVTATGHYDTEHQFAVRNRSQNENAGWYVVTPLVLDDGSAVLVNQGWIPVSNSDVPTTQLPAFPPVPGGTVTVTGYLQPDETTANTRITDDTAQLPHGEIALITKPDLQSRVPYQLHDGSIQLNASTPAETAATAAQPVPRPSYDNTMYIAYMVQWWVFAVVMPITWLKLLHREAHERLARENAPLEQDEDWDEEDWDEDEDSWDEGAAAGAGDAGGDPDRAEPGTVRAAPVPAGAASSDAGQPGE